MEGLDKTTPLNFAGSRSLRWPALLNDARAKARAAGAPRYFSKLCPKHPELKGERHTRSGLWPACVERKVQATGPQSSKDGKTSHDIDGW